MCLHRLFLFEQGKKVFIHNKSPVTFAAALIVSCGNTIFIYRFSTRYNRAGAGVFSVS